MPALPTLPAFPLQHQPETLSITRRAIPSHPFSVVGPRGAVLGQQNGSYEVWLFPWKILNRVRLQVKMENYDVPINVNAHAASITVWPDATTITFSHANFTIRETIFVPKHVPDGAGALIFYQIQAVRPMTLTVSLNPVMQRMWPAESPDRPSSEWVKTSGGSGFYILHLNFPEHAAAIAMPTAQPGIQVPYQERGLEYPLQFVLHFDPKHDADTYFPLLITMGNTTATSNKAALAKQLAELDQDFRSLYEGNRQYYDNFSKSSLDIDTPDDKLNRAFRWAEISIDQLRVQTTPAHDEEALTAGFVGSGDTARPGFGWFFGRDALWSLYAVDSYGGFQTARQEFEFLIRRESPEGKVPHEWSQTANLVDWKALPYEYASADATPLLLMAADDYLRISGDTAFIAAHWDGFAKAWNFERTHDSDGDGIYDNSQGSGWVESWVPKMPHQEIYLAALDEQASIAFANLAKSTGHSDLQMAAEQRAARIRAQVEKEYYLPKKKFYAFSWNGPGQIDQTPTILPAVAWWDGTYSLQHNQEMAQRWASPKFSTDWGTRIVGDDVSFYDPISYHQGSVWPLFTGWVSVAEYRTGHPLAGWIHLEQNANLTWAQDLGNATELLSGKFFQPLGRSTAHQLWSSAMIVSPVVRGLFGLEWNAAQHELSVTPSLPAQWNYARLTKIPFGDKSLDLSLQREDGSLVVRAGGGAPSAVRLRSRIAGAQHTREGLRIPLPAVEAGVEETLPQPGSVTSQMKVLNEASDAHSLTIHLAASGGSTQTIYLRINSPRILAHRDRLTASGVELPTPMKPLQKLKVAFAASSSNTNGYVMKEISFHW
ncbi:MAG: amylo-alpha-1,6-glucosidase [Acidobacteriaceae bacterium]